MAAGRAPGLLCTFATATLRFLAAALEPVEHLRGRVDLVVVLPPGKHRQIVQVVGEPAASFGRCTKPFSIIAVCACIRMILSDCGW